ncbi:MFS transporter [Cellulomonas sp. NPDC057328]|uniref:MFS transporter n=1 Tax=Cellulomonas sp. NPDC057328 TaxID=3346101 RepID=UPI00362815DC
MTTTTGRPATAGRPTTGAVVTVAGMLLVATTYGMARFGVGLFAPALADERPQLADVLGWAAAAQFTSYSVAALAAARLVDRRPRAGLVLAGLTATAGCLGVAVAGTPAVLVAAVFVAGMGGGFASPALVPVVDAVVPARARPAAQSVVNAGTAVGVVGAGLVSAGAPALAPAWLLMALLCAGTAAAAWWSARSVGARRAGSVESAAPGAGASVGAGDGTAGGPSVRADDGTAARAHDASTGSADHRPAPARWPLLAPAAAAVVVGAGSALTWTFGPLLLTAADAVPPARVGWLWITLGAGGLLGVLTGALVARLGLRRAWCACAAALALATAGVALAVATAVPAPAYAGTALFGAAYMAASGVLILWARQVRPAGAGAATSVLFVALATGQAAGSAGFGVARGVLDPVVLAVVAVALCLVGGVGALVRPRGTAAP